MITVKLNQANFEYDIHSLIKAFYPKQDVSVSAEEKRHKEQILFHVEGTIQEQEIRFAFYDAELSAYSSETGIPKTVEVKWEEEPSKEEAAKRKSKKPLERTQEMFLTDTAAVVVEGADRKETKNRLKRLLYQMLSRRTGQMLPWGTLTGIRPTKIPMKLFAEGKSEEEVRTYMQQTYLASEEKIQLSMDIAKREAALLSKLDYENGYSLYIGIPFCPSTCLYCSFTSYPLGKWKEQVDAYLDVLEKEILFTAEQFRDKHLNTIYIGGGTPTTLSPKQLDRLITMVKQNFDLSHVLEFTVEAGRPDSITREKLEVLRAHEVSRISINPQTMKQATLDLIGRHHTVQQTIDSFLMARGLGFSNINMDLIMGLPQENVSDVRHTLEELKKLDPDNVTVHSLAIKRAARLHVQWADYKNFKMVNTQEHIDLTAKYMQEMELDPYYLYRQKNMAGNYENVGYAKPGKAGIYNILIMEEKQTIMALGAGATTKFVLDHATRMERVENVKDVGTYLERVDEMIARKKQKMEEIAWR
ncbi:MAG: coproporphyrinogen dehydrogenase HemZ [Lachnospiraceae bacterium]